MTSSGFENESELDEFLDSLGESNPVIKAAIVRDTLAAEPPVGNVGQSMTLQPYKMPPIKDLPKGGTSVVSLQQRRNICVIVKALDMQGIQYTAEEVWKAWPTEGDTFKLQRAGLRPSITAITNFFVTEEFKKDMFERGIEIAGQYGLTDIQIALLDILSNTTSTLTTVARLKKAGVTNSQFRSWKRQKPFAEALRRITGDSLVDAIGMADVQLASMAQNGNLNAIKYLNDMTGRGPNDRKAVDAMAFARIVLEVVQQHVTAEQAREISAGIDLASKQLEM